MRRLVPAFGVVLLVGLAVGLVALEPWHGPIVLSLSAGHGIDTGDLLAFPLVGPAIAVWRREVSAGEHVARSPSGPVRRRRSSSACC